MSRRCQPSARLFLMLGQNQVWRDIKQDGLELFHALGLNVQTFNIALCIENCSVASTASCLHSLDNCPENVKFFPGITHFFFAL